MGNTSSAGFEFRPRSLGELLDLTFRCFRRGFRTFAALGILTATTGAILTILVQQFLFQIDPLELAVPDAMEIGDLFDIYASLAVSSLFTLVIYTFGFLAITATTRSLLEGHSITAREALANAWPRVPAGAVASLLVTMAIMFGMVLCCIPAIPIGITLVLALPLVLLERLGPFDAIARSFEMVWKRGRDGINLEANWVRIALVGFMAIVVMYTFNLVANLPLIIASFISASRAQLDSTFTAEEILPRSLLLTFQLLGAMANGALVSVSIIPWTVVYYDIRVRHEGYDLELQTERLDDEHHGRSETDL